MWQISLSSDVNKHCQLCSSSSPLHRCDRYRYQATLTSTVSSVVRLVPSTDVTQISLSSDVKKHWQLCSLSSPLHRCDRYRYQATLRSTVSSVVRLVRSTDVTNIAMLSSDVNKQRQLCSSSSPLHRCDKYRYQAMLRSTDSSVVCV